MPVPFSPVSSYKIRGPFSKPKCSVLLMKQYFVCMYGYVFLRPLLKGRRFWGGWHHTGDNIPWRTKESRAFFGFSSEQNSRGKPDLAGKLHQS